ncbi:MAG: hypothetical protein A2X97_02485 [Bdellovibrionales bacterium GWA1_52_35]|nr:MAG: hypothetical protein A2X97_02485 [Bdellovibrionales bacterium GWA1_52_35]HCM40058.1 DNA mismatch repair endonuclease MutL [Bdellovibrionales bacterium]
MKIRVLDPHVAERIAAGEVIERPASVVKELLENSLDAGATEIQIVLEDGGKGLIEITDNGQGMNPDDLALSVKRHATSKLSSLEDLERISTLGFRGEALPSIAAVSELTLLSRTREAESAYEFQATPFEAPRKPAATTFGHFLNSPHGTRIRAVGLFSQVPARLKFLKSQAAEVSQVREWVERLALAHPSVGFKLLSGERVISNLRPTTEVNRVQAILADGQTDYPILSESGNDGSPANPLAPIKVRAHWLQGFSSGQTRKLVQVVNGRSVRDRLLQQAILQPFKQALMPGQFPAFALFLEIDPSELDVNVHPTKTEIRFLNSRVVFETVSRAVQGMIGKHGAPAFANSFSSSGSSYSSSGFGGYDGSVGSVPSWSVTEPGFTESAPLPGFATKLSETSAQPELPEFSALKHPLQAGRFVGTLFNTYIVYDQGQELALIDQHAADERIRYERLRARVFSETPHPVSQALLIPEAVQFAPELRVELEQRLSWLEALGFEVELFSENTLLFRGIPVDWSNQGIKMRLKSLVDRTLAAEEKPDSHSRDNLMDEALFETLAREACHSAVRAGDRLQPEQAAAILDQLFTCEHPWNCPHGRPTVVRVPRSKIEEWFQRRV